MNAYKFKKNNSSNNILKQKEKKKKKRKTQAIQYHLIKLDNFNYF